MEAPTNVRAEPVLGGIKVVPILFKREWKCMSFDLAEEFLVCELSVEALFDMTVELVSLTTAFLAAPHGISFILLSRLEAQGSCLDTFLILALFDLLDIGIVASFPRLFLPLIY
jgi:hypothetical protein